MSKTSHLNRFLNLRHSHPSSYPPPHHPLSPSPLQPHTPPSPPLLHTPYRFLRTTPSSSSLTPPPPPPLSSRNPSASLRTSPPFPFSPSPPPPPEHDFIFPSPSAYTQPHALYDGTVYRERTLSEAQELSPLLHEPVTAPRHGSAHPRSSSRELKRESVEGRQGGAVASDLHALPSPSGLPFEDGRMAEGVLEMDVEGQIGACWQDTATAYGEDVEGLLKVLQETQAWDPVVVCTKDKTYAFDYIVFASCHGARHISLVSWGLQEANRFVGLARANKRLRDTEWEPIPVGRIVVNLMTEEFRKRAQFERKWILTSSCDPLDFCHNAVCEGRGIASHGLWSLTLNLQDLEDYEIDYCREALLRQS